MTLWIGCCHGNPCLAVDGRFTRVFTIRNDVRGGRPDFTTGAIQTDIVIVLVIVLVLDDDAIGSGTMTGCRGENRAGECQYGDFEDEDRFAEDEDEDEKGRQFLCNVGVRSRWRAS